MNDRTDTLRIGTPSACAVKELHNPLRTYVYTLSSLWRRKLYLKPKLQTSVITFNFQALIPGAFNTSFKTFHPAPPYLLRIVVTAEVRLEPRGATHQGHLRV